MIFAPRGAQPCSPSPRCGQAARPRARGPHARATAGRPAPGAPSAGCAGRARHPALHPVRPSRPGRGRLQGHAVCVCAASAPEAPACTAAAEAKEGQDAQRQLFGAFTVIGSLRTSGPQRLAFRFAEAMLKLGSRSLWLPPFGRGWFDVVYMDTRLRVTRDSRGDTSVLLRVGDLQIEDGDVLLGGLY